MLPKAHYRRQMRDLLQTITAQQLAVSSARIRDHLLALPQVESAASVFCYVSAPGEIDTHALLTELFARGKTICVPLILGPRQMQATCITTLADCTAGAFGLLEPRSPRPFEGDPDICITPGLAFTPSGARLGKAGGYYDTFLGAHPISVAIALALDEQVVDQLPMMETDRYVQLIVTPTRVIRCTAEKS
jgi:5-formyltetrahydrofolate cyclo-ligase